MGFKVKDEQQTDVFVWLEGDDGVVNLYINGNDGEEIYLFQLLDDGTLELAQLSGFELPSLIQLEKSGHIKVTKE